MYKLKKRKNKPYCKLRKESIELAEYRNCNNKKYKKSTYNRKSPVVSGETVQNYLQCSAKLLQKMKNKSKKMAKLERNRSSVFTNDLEHCYLCGRKKEDLHEVYAGRNRLNSIKYNFVLPLCRKCHSQKQNNQVFNDYWHKQGQLYWEEFIGTREEFIKVFKRNYLE